jgi:hypothetical protein
MLREDVSGRFDYLFEPLEFEESAGDGDEAATDAFAQPADEGRWSRRIVLSGVVVATLAAAAVTVVAMLQPAQPAPLIIRPTDATPLSTPVSTAVAPVLSTPMPSTTEPPVAVLPATVSTTVVRTPTATPTVAPQPPPVQPPRTVASEPPATMPPPPTTRAPISVSPETRAPFPNQIAPRKNDDGGGLLGGLGGLL